MTHKVNRLVFEIAGAPQNGVSELQNRMSLFANNELIPELDRIFNKIIPPDQLISIDKLEINLSALSMNHDLEQQILDQLRIYFEDQNNFELQSQLPKIHELKKQSEFNSSKTTSETSASQDKGIEDFELLTGINPSNKEVKFEEAERAFKILTQFLSTGNLPWNAVSLTLSDLKKLALLCFENEKFQNEFKNNLLPNSVSAVIRLLNILPLEEANKLIIHKDLLDISDLIKDTIKYLKEKYSTEYQSTSQIESKKLTFIILINIQQFLFSKEIKLMNDIENELKLFISSKTEAKFLSSLSLQIIELIQTILLEKPPILLKDNQPEIDNEENLVETSIEDFFNQAQKFTEQSSMEPHQTDTPEIDNEENKDQESSRLASEYQGIEGQESIEASFADFFKKIKEDNQSQKKESTASNLSQIDEDIISLDERLKEFRKKHSAEIQQDRTFVDKEDEEKTYYIQNAGLVLLAPFFSHLFKELELLGENGFKNSDSQNKAISLTTYIYSGTEEANEHELTLNKILCGLNPSSNIDLDNKLTENEKELANELITSAINYWSALKNTGIEAFRSTFLKRNGIISPAAEGNWLLRIERTAFDVLIDTLPWPISVHRYSWMKKLLTVEW